MDENTKRTLAEQIVALVVEAGGQEAPHVEAVKAKSTTLLNTVVLQADATRASYEDTLRMIGEQHSSHIEGYEAQIAELESEAGEARIALQGAVTTESTLRADLEQARKMEEVHRDAATDAISDMKRAERLADERSKEIDRLRDDLHRMTIENAKLQGYVDRVQERDVLTEREAVHMDIMRGREDYNDIVTGTRPNAYPRSRHVERVRNMLDAAVSGLSQPDTDRPAWHLRRQQ